jgi:hypothetical protein
MELFIGVLLILSGLTNVGVAVYFAYSRAR